MLLGAQEEEERDESGCEEEEGREDEDEDSGSEESLVDSDSDPDEKGACARLGRGGGGVTRPAAGAQGGLSFRTRLRETLQTLQVEGAEPGARGRG